MYNREVHMACPLKFTVLFVFIFCIFGIVECATHSNVINHCIDKQPCIGTYGDIYNALASAKNSFNIRSALYPALKPSSVRVFVNVYGPNGTQSLRSNACKYTWSTNCLFVALPAAVLQVMSLSSILVDPRTEHLDITLPSFCCEVCKNDREKMIKDVIAELQDLAVSPAIPDPRLNTAECVIKGHDPKILDTGRSGLIYSMLFCSFVSVMLLGPLLANFILRYLKKCAKKTISLCFRKETPKVLAADSTVGVMLLIEIPIIIYSLAKSCKTELPMIFIIIFLIIITAEGPVIISILKWRKKKRGERGIDQDIEGDNRDNQDNEGGSSGNQDTEGGSTGDQDSEGGSSDSQDTEGGSTGDHDTSFRSLIYYVGVNLVLYHFFWLLIGIMITPTWGLTVFLAIVVLFIVFFLAVLYFVENACLQAGVFYGVLFFGFFFAAVVPVLAGYSFYGRETAADIIKVVLLYIITALIPKIIKFHESLTSKQGEP